MATKADLYETLSLVPEGLTFSELHARHLEVKTRTAHRWLAELIKQGRIEHLGAGRGPGGKYRIRVATRIEPANDEASIPLSPGGKEVFEYVQREVRTRNSIGYQREFLARYEPNQTFYLPDAARRQLHNIGRTDTLVHPAGTYGRSILDRLLVDLSWASSHLEGNTYSLLDTIALIERGKVADGRESVETQMILNHKSAIELLLENIETVKFDRYTVMNVHATLAENLLEDASDEGRLRQRPVGIGASVYSPLSTPQHISEEFDQFLQKVTGIADPFEQSFFAMVHLPYLQPFADVNKRTSRLLANIPLLKANLVPLTFIDVSVDSYNSAVLGVYEMTRVDLLRDLYMWAYPKSAGRYQTIKRDISLPDPTRLAHRDAIRAIVREVVLRPEDDAIALIASEVRERVSSDDAQAVEELVNEELRVLHEGSLARYGIRPSEFARWQAR